MGHSTALLESLRDDSPRAGASCAAPVVPGQRPPAFRRSVEGGAHPTGIGQLLDFSDPQSSPFYRPRSQSLTVLSTLPVASDWPSGEKATE